MAFDGPVGIRINNGRFKFELLMPKPEGSGTPLRVMNPMKMSSACKLNTRVGGALRTFLANNGQRLSGSKYSRYALQVGSELYLCPVRQ